MISIEEICKYPLSSLPIDHQINLYRVHYALNLIRSYYNKPITITSGYRSKEDQIEIYRKKDKTPPMGSQHLIGAAADLWDPDGSLKLFFINRKALYETLDIYFERFDSTPDWVHIQLYRPASQDRFFIP